MEKIEGLVKGKRSCKSATKKLKNQTRVVRTRTKASKVRMNPKDSC